MYWACCESAMLYNNIIRNKWDSLYQIKTLQFERVSCGAP
jgi:hypothetical protein